MMETVTGISGKDVKFYKRERDFPGTIIQMNCYLKPSLIWQVKFKDLDPVFFSDPESLPPE